MLVVEKHQLLCVSVSILADLWDNDGWLRRRTWGRADSCEMTWTELPGWRYGSVVVRNI